jgi:carboxypeptidase C (cathepsin A)
MKHHIQGISLFALTLFIALSAWGQGGRGAAPPQTGAQSGLYNYDATSAAPLPPPNLKPSETKQKIMLAGEALAYTARAGYLPLRNATTDQVEAYLFYTSYTKDAAGDPALRPLMVFLGGAPGVAAAWQEFGGFGPKRMKWADDGTPAAPPYIWVDNPETLLGSADLVFVNPVGTAYSRPGAPSRGPGFWNTSGDAASMGEFVREYLNANDRRSSPLFIAGEDFGTGRAAASAAYLQDHHIPVAGVILISMTLAADAVTGDGQYLTLLPSLALAAWSHKKLAPEMLALGPGDLAEQARLFASREYLHALYKGDRMTPEEKAKVTASLERLTGLPKAFLVNNDLRVSLDRFNAELLQGDHRTPSLQDARIAGFVPATGGQRGGFGGFGGGGAAPSIDYRQSRIAGPFLAAYETYLKRELGFTSGTGRFYLASGGVGTYTAAGSDEASLSAAFVRNPRLRLFVGINYFDLQAPFYAIEFTLAQMAVSPEVRTGNITVGHYEAGQMPFLDPRARTKLQSDLAKFIGREN